MKRVSLFIISPILIFYCLTPRTQTLDADTLFFRSFLLTEVYGEFQKDINSDVTFFLQGDKMITSQRDQRKTIHFLEEPQHDVYYDHPVIRRRAIDNGGYNCVFYLGVEPQRENTWFIVLAYNNVIFFYEVRELPVPMEELDLLRKHDLYEKSIFDKIDDDYTNREVDEFLEQFGNPELIKKLMIYELYNELL